MLEKMKTEAFEYQKLSPAEMESRGILGRLVGPCADFINPTRNGRGYSEELWDKVFEDPIVQEKINNKCLFGELGHPADREEVDLEKIAIALNEKPKKSKDGKLVACFDILGTPAGKILKTLCDYGTTIGISSRGSGDLIEDADGNEAVDPDTYNFECFDAVIVPAVESARLQYVTESLNTNGAQMKHALCEALEKASDKDKKIMQETLDTLNIKLDESNSENCGDKKAEATVEEPVTEEVVSDTMADTVIKELQEALTAKAELEVQIKDLQEKLAVSDTKVSEITEECNKYKETVIRLSTVAQKSKSLKEQLTKLESDLKDRDEKISSYSKVDEELKSTSAANSKLSESLAVKDSKIVKLNEKLIDTERELNKKIDLLTEQLSNEKSHSLQLEEDYKAKITRIKTNCKHAIVETLRHYISSKAKVLGLKEEEIINRLPQDYSLNDIDKICENLQTYVLNVSKMPWKLNQRVKAKITESVNDPLVQKDTDDDVDDSLMNLIK